MYSIYSNFHSESDNKIQHLSSHPYISCSVATAAGSPDYLYFKT